MLKISEKFEKAKEKISALKELYDEVMEWLEKIDEWTGLNLKEQISQLINRFKMCGVPMFTVAVSMLTGFYLCDKPHPTRVVRYEIKGDYHDQQLKPRRFSLREVHPGKYKLGIYVPGYLPVDEEITIAPGNDIFLVRRQLKSRPRRFILKLQANNSSTITPDQVLLDNRVLTLPAYVKPQPEGYQLLITKAGYHPYRTHITVKPCEKPLVIAARLQVKPRPCIFVLDTDYQPGHLVTADRILLNDQVYRPDTPVYPAQYQITISKKGFHRLRFQHTIPPGEGPYRVAQTLQAQKRLLKFQIASNLNPDTPLVPDEVTLDQQPIKSGEAIKPKHSGYTVVIVKKGYVPYHGHLPTPPGEGPLVLSAVLIKKRGFLFVLRSNYDQQSLTADQIFLNGNPYQADCLYPPGRYHIRIVKTGYQPFSCDYDLHSGLSPVRFQQTLHAAPRILRIKITDNWKSQKPQVKLDGKLVQDGQAYSPGMYTLDVQTAYYRYSQKLALPPAAAPFELCRQLALKLQAQLQGPSQIDIGCQGVYTLKVTNTSPVTLRHIQVQLELPTGLRLADKAPASPSSIELLPPGKAQQRSYEISAVQAGEFSLKANIQLAQQFFQATKLALTVRAPRLIITVQGARRLYLQRRAIYRLVIHNQGNGLARQTQVSWRIPGNLHYLRARPAAQLLAQQPGSLLSWKLGNLAAGDQKSLRVHVRACRAGTDDQVIQVQAAAVPKQRLAQPVQVQGLPRIRLHVRDTHDPCQVVDHNNYINLVNQGNAAATNLVITVKLPKQMTYQQAEPAPSSQAGQRIVFLLASLIPGQSQTYRIDCQAVKPGAATTNISIRYEEFTKAFIYEVGTYVM